MPLPFVLKRRLAILKKHRFPTLGKPRNCVRECCKGSEVCLGKFLPVRECYKLARECCKASEVRLGKFLPVRECFNFTLRCSEEPAREC